MRDDDDAVSFAALATRRYRISTLTNSSTCRRWDVVAVTATLPADVVGPVCAAWIGQDFANAAEDGSRP